MRKRGRKPRDDIDQELEQRRQETKRGCRYVGIREDVTADQCIQAVLARELEVLKSRDLVEFREAPVNSVETNDAEDGVSGSPVCTRLMIPHLSAMKCLTNSMRQIAHATQDDAHTFSFTPECHVLMSKACELFVVEMTSRAYRDAAVGAVSSNLSADNLVLGTTSAWRTTIDDVTRVSPFDFLCDVPGTNGRSEEPLDILGRLHSSQFR
jgi:hypothetical protein